MNNNPMNDNALRALVQVRRGSFELNVTLEVRAGEVLAVIGPNGAGKTTLLRSLAGLDQELTGHISIGDQLVFDSAHGIDLPSAHRRVGYVFQDYRLFPHLDVLANVAFAARAHGRGSRASRAVAQQWLHRLGMQEYSRRRPHELSGGQAQRVAVARALASEPRLLLLDEPSAALDATSRGEVRSLLHKELHGTDVPTVLVTHDPLEAMLLADRMLVLEQGRVVQQGTTAEVARRPTTDWVAHLVGLNLLTGQVSDNGVTLATGEHVAAPTLGLHGAVLASFSPSALAVHSQQPALGSGYTVWHSTVKSLESLGDRVRLQIDTNPPVVVDVTHAAVAELALTTNTSIWLSLDATDVDVYPAP